MKEFETKSQFQVFAERNGISLVKMHTRFGTIEYFVEDRIHLDDIGLPSIVCQCGDIYEAVKVFRKLSDSQK